MESIFQQIQKILISGRVNNPTANTLRKKETTENNNKVFQKWAICSKTLVHAYKD